MTHCFQQKHVRPHVSADSRERGKVTRHSWLRSVFAVTFCRSAQFSSDVQLMSVSVVHDPKSLLSGHPALLSFCVSTLMSPLSWCAKFNWCCNVRVSCICVPPLRFMPQPELARVHRVRLAASQRGPNEGAELYVVLFCTRHLVLLTTVVKDPHSQHEMSQRICGNEQIVHDPRKPMVFASSAHRAGYAGLCLA